MHSNIFDRLSFLSLFLLVVLLPVFCLPFTNFPVEISKGLLVVIGLTISIIFWAMARFSDGQITLPKSRLIGFGFGVVIITLLSAMMSGTATIASQVSLFGTILDVGTFWFIFIAFALMCMSAVVFRTPQKAKTLLLGTILASAVVLIFQSIHLFLPTALSLGLFADKTGNVLGSWNALGFFAGFSSLMFLLVIEFFPISKIEKIVLQVFILLSMLLAAAVNYPMVWLLLGISSLIIFVYKVSSNIEQHVAGGVEGVPVAPRVFPIISFAVVMISLLFFLSSGFVGSFIPNRLNISNTEITPSLSATMSITKGVLSHHPMFGIGPNRFAEAWAMYKPAIINTSEFWNVSFDSGSGLLPTFFATTGGLGIIAWLIFFFLFFTSGVKSVFASIKNRVNWEMMAFFVLSLYLFIASFLYFTGTVIFLLGMVFTGVFIGLSSSASGKEVTVLFLNDHRKSFFSILVLIFAIVASIGLSFKYIERFVSVSYFGKALSAQTEPLAEVYIGKALALYPNDLYLRTYSQIYLVKLNSIASKGSTLSDTDKADLQTAFTQAVNGAQVAASYDSSNYLNPQLLGSVYQAVGSLGVKDSYSKAVLAYQDASKLNPLNPGLKLAQASAAFADNKVEDAKTYANQALTLKPDYIDALVVLSQIAHSQGDSALAMTYAQSALNLAPTDKNLIQYVDSLNTASTPPPATPNPTNSKK